MCWLRLYHSDRKKKYNYNALKHATFEHETLNHSGLSSIAKLPKGPFQHNHFLLLHLATEPSGFRLFLKFPLLCFQIVISNLIIFF